MFAIFRKNVFFILLTLALGVALLLARYNTGEYALAHPHPFTGKGGGDNRDLANSLNTVALTLALTLLPFLSSCWVVFRLLFFSVAFVAVSYLMLIGYLYIISLSPDELPSISTNTPIENLIWLSLGSYVVLLLLAYFRRKP